MSGSLGGWIHNNSPIPITKKPDLNDPVLRAKLAKGMGHNYYGEPAWPNDLLYIFPVIYFLVLYFSVIYFPAQHFNILGVVLS